MSTLALIKTSQTYTTRVATRDEWDRDDTCTDHTVQKLVLDPSGDLYYKGRIAKGDKVNVIYAIYSTGDSFGHDDRLCFETFTVHKDPAVALFNYKVLMAASKSDGYTQVTIYQDDGTPTKVGVPWTGYFEHLDQLENEEFIVE